MSLKFHADGKLCWRPQGRFGDVMDPICCVTYRASNNDAIQPIETISTISTGVVVLIGLAVEVAMVSIICHTIMARMLFGGCTQQASQSPELGRRCQLS